MTQDIQELLARSEERERKARERSESLRRIATAEAEIPSLWRTGEVSQNQLVQKYGIAPVTVKRILRDAGLKVTRVRKLSDDDRAQVVALLRVNESIIVLADQFGVSQNTIRRVGLETGVLEKGKRKPRRSDAEYELIQAFDDECRQRFGQGLYNVGIGLKTYKQRQKAKAEALKHATSEPQPVDGDGNEIPPPPEPLGSPPPVAPEDPDTQLGGNDNPQPAWPTDAETPEEAQSWRPPVEPDPAEDTPYVPDENTPDPAQEPSPLTEADFSSGFKAPGEPNF